MTARAFLVALLVLTPLAGCIEGESDILIVPYANGLDVQVDRNVTFAVVVENRAPFRMEDVPVSVANVPAGWRVTPETTRLVVNGTGTTSLLVNATPTTDAAHGLQRFTLMVGDGAVDLFARVVPTVADDPEAREGIGVRVYTVGFWNNGTTFYYNWREVHDNPNLPKFDLGPDEDENFDPLPVYVGGRRGEEPPAPYNESGYFPVITGFDHALRGLRAGETTATRIPSEFAYTSPGNEDHALYGDALNFLILVLSVDELPEEGGSDLPVCPPPVC